MNTAVGLEFKVGKLTYDIFVPTKNLLIEYNGLKWHSKSSSKMRDVRKYENAIEHKYDYLMIFEDEWEHDRTKMECIIKDKLNGSLMEDCVSDGSLISDNRFHRISAGKPRPLGRPTA